MNRMYRERQRRSERSFNEQMLQVQQQFLRHRENISYKLEELVELATQKFQLIQKIRKVQDVEFVNPCGRGSPVKQFNSSESSGEVKSESLPHLNLRSPKFEFEEGSVVFETVVGTGNTTHEWPKPNPTEEGNADRKAEIEDYQESPRYDEVPGEDKEDWHSEEFILTALGLEDSSQYKLNFKADTSTGAKGLECPTDVNNSFASVPTAVLAYVPKKIHAEIIEESELRITSTQVVSALKEGLDKPKELKPELHVPESWTIQLQGRLHCDTYLNLVSQDVVSMEVSGKAVGSTQQLFVAILVHYKAITIFDPGGYLSCLYEAKLLVTLAWMMLLMRMKMCSPTTFQISVLHHEDMLNFKGEGFVRNRAVVFSICSSIVCSVIKSH